MMDKDEKMVVDFYDVLMSAFDGSGQHDVDINLEEISEDGEATQMIINMIKALSVVFQELTGERMSHFEFTKVVNTLIVQDLIDIVRAESEGE